MQREQRAHVSYMFLKEDIIGLQAQAGLHHDRVKTYESEHFYVRSKFMTKKSLTLAGIDLKESHSARYIREKKPKTKFNSY